MWLGKEVKQVKMIAGSGGDVVSANQLLNYTVGSVLQSSAALKGLNPSRPADEVWNESKVLIIFCARKGSVLYLWCCSEEF